MPPTSASELSADQVERFAHDLAALADPGAHLLVALSGGPDSVALLLLAHAALGTAAAPRRSITVFAPNRQTKRRGSPICAPRAASATRS